MPSDVFAEDSDWSPHVMYEQYLSKYKTALANRATVAEKVQGIYNEKVSAYNDGLDTLFEKYKCCPAGTKCNLLSLGSACKVDHGFLVAKSYYVTEINGRKITRFNPGYDLMIVNLDMWNPYLCQKEDGGNGADCQKESARRAAAETAAKTATKSATSTYSWWSNLLSVAKINIPSTTTMSKSTAYQILSTLNPIVINSDADSVRNLQSALNAFKLPYKAEDLIPPDMDLLVKWKISSDLTDLMLKYWAGSSGSVEWYQDIFGKQHLSFKASYISNLMGKTRITSICPPLSNIGRAEEEEECGRRKNRVVNLAVIGVAKDLEATE